MMAESSTLSSPITGEAKHIHSEVGAPSVLEESIMFICIPLGILGIIGNGIITYLFCYAIKNSRFTVYFQVIDIANITVLMNHFIYFFRSLSELNIDLFFFHIIQMLEVLGYSTRFYVLTAICVERYAMIFFPVCYKRYRPKHFSIMVTGFLVALSCSITVVHNLACTEYFYTTSDEFIIKCASTSILRVLVELLLFLLIMAFSTVGILISMKTQQTSPRLDITIVAMVLLFVLTDTPIRVTDIIAFWIEGIDPFIFTTVAHLFDTINCVTIPLIFLIVGCWKIGASKPFNKFLERALQFKNNMEERTQADEEQA